MIVEYSDILVSSAFDTLSQRVEVVKTFMMSKLYYVAKTFFSTGRPG